MRFPAIPWELRKYKFTKKERRAHQPGLVKACEDGEVDLATEAVSFGADINKEGQCNFHPLILASFNGFLNVVIYLVQKGALLDKATIESRMTPLIVATIEGHTDIVLYLLEEGANVNNVDSDGWSPLHWSARVNIYDEKIGKLLMSYGADLNAKTNNGELAIDLAYSEAMKQAIRDEPRRRMDHGYKRATEQDRHPNAAATASAQQEEEGEEEMHSNKRHRIDETTVTSAGAEETKVASEDEDSESSDIEDDCY